MIDIHDGELKDLWPNEKSPEFLALSYAIKLQIAHLLVLSTKVGVSYDIDDLNEEVLDYMAVELRVMYYDQALPLDTKRTLVKNALSWRSHAGTTGAVAEMLQTIFGTGDVVEWYEGGYKPNEFRVVVDARSTPETAEQISRIISRVKNVRSHLIALTFSKKAQGKLYIGAMEAANRFYTVNNSPQLSYREDGSAYIGTAVGSIKLQTVADGRHLSSRVDAAGPHAGGACLVYKRIQI